MHRVKISVVDGKGNRRSWAGQSMRKITFAEIEKTVRKNNQGLVEVAVKRMRKSRLPRSCGVESLHTQPEVQA